MGAKNLRYDCCWDMTKWSLKTGSLNTGGHNDCSTVTVPHTCGF